MIEVERSTAASPLNKVAQSEFELLSLARGLFLADKSRSMESLLATPRKLPKEYSSMALSLLEDTLAKGSIIGLARQGSLNTRLATATSEKKADYWWSRNQVQTLRFSDQSIELLRWMLKSKLNSLESSAGLDSSTRELGDEVLLYFMGTRLCDFQYFNALEKSIAFRRNPLCWLGFFNHFAKTATISPAELKALDFDSLLTDHAWVLEALQKSLLTRWLTIEASKSQISDPEYMIRLGDTQALILNHLLDVAEKNKRLDLLFFVFQAGGRIIQNSPSSSYWVKSLVPEAMPLSAYTEAKKASIVLFTTIEARYPVIQNLTAIRFFDDDYAYSQLVLGQWECYGEHGLEKARKLINELTAINQAQELVKEE